MSQENVELVRCQIEALNRGDREGSIEGVDSGIEGIVSPLRARSSCGGRKLDPRGCHSDHDPARSGPPIGSDRAIYSGRVRKLGSVYPKAYPPLLTSRAAVLDLISLGDFTGCPQ
jgi:hypothetical protein